MQDVLLNIKNQWTTFWEETVLGNVSHVGARPAPVAAADDVAQIYGLHSILKYDQFDTSNDLFYNETSVGFCFEVLPQTGADAEMAERLSTLFTPIPPGYGVQWCFFASPMLDEQYGAYRDLRHIAKDKGLTDPLFLELANKRITSMRRNPGRPLFANDNFMAKNLRLVFSITKTGSPKDRTLVAEILEIRETVKAALSGANLPSHTLGAQGLIEFLWPILNPGAMFSPEMLPRLEYDPGKILKNQMTAFGQHVRVTSKEILFGLPPENVGEEDKRIAVRALGVLRYPQKKELWEMANIIGSFFDDSLQYPCPFLICGGVFTLDANISDAKAQFRSGRAKMNAKSKMAEYQPELESKALDWDVVMRQISNGGTLCELYHSLILFAPRPSIDRVTQAAITIWRNERFAIASLEMVQLATFYASLPMTLTEAARDDLVKLRLISTKTTINAVDMSPILGEWRGAGDPVMMFYGRRGSPASLDLYSNQQGNYNAFVAGVSGSGKSVFMNELVSSYRSIGARAWVIDVGRSYQNLIRLQKGTFIEFKPYDKNTICINPFSWIGSDNEIDFKEEMKLLKPMIGRMASPNAPLSEFQYSLIVEAITKCWADYGQDTNPTKIQSFLLGKIKNEKNETERVAYELGKQLQPFTEEGVFGAYFNGRANLDLDGDMIGLELEELKNSPELRRVVLFVLTSRIAHDMYLTRDRKKLCLVDEAWQLLGADKETAEFIEEGYRRARKYKGIFCVGTQSIADAYTNAASQAAYTNADWKFFLRQDKKSLEKLIDDGTVNFDPVVKRMLMSLSTQKGRYAEILISSPNGDAVVRHIPDPFALLAASTEAEDFTEIEQLLGQGRSTMQALTEILRRRGQIG